MELVDDPRPVDTELEDDPRPVDTELVDDPRPVDTELVDDPRPVDTELEDDPRPVDTELEDDPRPVDTELLPSFNLPPPNDNYMMCEGNNDEKVFFLVTKHLRMQKVNTNSDLILAST